MEARKLEPEAGLKWVKEGWQLFSKSPLLWMAYAAIAVLILFSAASIPVAGDTLATLLLPLLQAGFLIGCRLLQQGGKLDIVRMLTGFRERTPQLIALGAMVFVAEMLIMGMMQLTGGEKLMELFTGAAPTDNSEAVAQAVSEAGLSIVLGSVLYFLLIMSMQFATALVLFARARPLEALKGSLKACLANMLALSIYAVIMLAAATAVTVVLQGSVLSLLAALAMLPYAMAVTYSAYRDIFPGLS